MAQRFRRKKKEKKAPTAFEWRNFRSAAFFRLHPIHFISRYSGGDRGETRFLDQVRERTPRFPKLAKACQLGRRRKGRVFFLRGDSANIVFPDWRKKVGQMMAISLLFFLFGKLRENGELFYFNSNLITAAFAKESKAIDKSPPTTTIFPPPLFP